MVGIITADAKYRVCDYEELSGKNYRYILYAPDQHMAKLQTSVIYLNLFSYFFIFKTVTIAFIKTCNNETYTLKKNTKRI